MSHESTHVRFFFRQCVYALACFSFFCIVGEWLVPGSVSPFIDPVPLAILALLLLVIDAMA